MGVPTFERAHVEGRAAIGGYFAGRSYRHIGSFRCEVEIGATLHITINGKSPNTKNWTIREGKQQVYVYESGIQDININTEIVMYQTKPGYNDSKKAIYGLRTEKIALDHFRLFPV